MKFLGTLLVTTAAFLLAQALPDEWSQSYGTYDIAHVGNPGTYSFGFAHNNYTIYSNTADTTAYDTRRFDIFARYVLVKRLSIEIKYSSPTSGIVGGKYQIVDGNMNIAFKLGVGYMKGTRSGFVTDYVFDLYPTLILNKTLYKSAGIYFSPKMIYSIHPRDRQEHTDREPRQILQYGHGFGLYVGHDFIVMAEGNWLFGNNEGVKYTVNQFGLGVCLKIK